MNNSFQPWKPWRTSVLLACLLTCPAFRLLAAAPTPKDQAPPVVDPGPPGGPPSDAVVLFDGKDMSKWRGERSDEPKWRLGDGCMETTQTGGIFSKEEFGDCQLHVEWASPSVVKGEGQGRGNSGVYLQGRYEIQVLDSYNSKTYPNGQAGAFYGHNAPQVNACRKPGEWQAYDIIFHAPKKTADGQVKARLVHGPAQWCAHPGSRPGGGRADHGSPAAWLGRKGAAFPAGPRQSRALPERLDPAALNLMDH